MVLTGAATPVSITAYQDAGNSARPWLLIKPPAPGILAGAIVDTEPDTAVSRARGVLYAQFVTPTSTRIVRVRVRLDVEERIYDVSSARAVDGMLVLELASLWEDGV